MPTYNLQNISPVSRKVNHASGILKKRVVVNGAADREVTRPSGANGGAVAGVALEGGADKAHIPVQTDGEAICVAAGIVARDAQVNIADTEGKVKAVSEAASTVINKVGVALTPAGAAGDEITVSLQIERYTA